MRLVCKMCAWAMLDRPPCAMPGGRRASGRTARQGAGPRRGAARRRADHRGGDRRGAGDEPHAGARGVHPAGVEGLLRLYPKRGALVVPVSAPELEAVIETRWVIERYAIERAMRAGPVAGDLCAAVERQDGLRGRWSSWKPTARSTARSWPPPATRSCSACTTPCATASAAWAGPPPARRTARGDPGRAPRDRRRDRRRRGRARAAHRAARPPRQLAGEAAQPVGLATSCGDPRRRCRWR